jgi:hypothetical protein
VTLPELQVTGHVYHQQNTKDGPDHRAIHFFDFATGQKKSDAHTQNAGGDQPLCEMGKPRKVEGNFFTKVVSNVVDGGVNPRHRQDPVVLKPFHSAGFVIGVVVGDYVAVHVLQ